MMSLNKNSSLKDSQEQTSVRFNEQNLFEVVSGLRLKSHKILSLAFFLSSRRSAHDSPHASEQSSGVESEEENERDDRNICFARCFQCTLRRLERNDKTGENHIARAPLSASRAALVVVGSFIFLNMLLNWKPKRRWFFTVERVKEESG